MSGHALALSSGLRLVYDGELWEVVELDGTRVVLRSDRTAQFSAVQIGRLVAGARPVGRQPEPLARPGPGTGRVAGPVGQGHGHRPSGASHGAAAGR